MKLLLALLPLLGFVTAQQMNGHMQGNVNGGHGTFGTNKDGFFNDFGQSTTLPPWAKPAPNAGGAGQHAAAIGGNIGGSQSSTKPPGGGGAAPFGNPQLPAVAGANADPSRSGGSSGGLAGFGAFDYFNGGGSPDVLSPQANAPVVGSNPRQNSDPYGIGEGNIPRGTYEAASKLQQQTMQNGRILPGELGGGIGIGAGPGTVPGRTSTEVINPDYFGGPGVGAGGGRGANHGQSMPNGGNQGMLGAGQVPSRGTGGTGNGGMGHAGLGNPAFDTPGVPSPMGGAGFHPSGRSSAEIHHGFDAGLVPHGGGMPGRGGMNGGGMAGGGRGGGFNNLLSQGEEETGGNSSGATGAGIAAGVLIVAAAVGALAFLLVRKRKHSRLFNAV